jgi:hypothetical protein
MSSNPVGTRFNTKLDGLANPTVHDSANLPIQGSTLLLNNIIVEQAICAVSSTMKPKTHPEFGKIIWSLPSFLPDGVLTGNGFTLKTTLDSVIQLWSSRTMTVGMEAMGRIQLQAGFVQFVL